MRCYEKIMISAKIIFIVYYKSMDVREVEVHICRSERSRSAYLFYEESTRNIYLSESETSKSTYFSLGKQIRSIWRLPRWKLPLWIRDK